MGEKQLEMIKEIINDPQISIVELSQKIGISTTAIENRKSIVKTKELIKGYWEIDRALDQIIRRDNWGKLGEK